MGFLDYGVITHVSDRCDIHEPFKFLDGDDFIAKKLALGKKVCDVALRFGNYIKSNYCNIIRLWLQLCRVFSSFFDIHTSFFHERTIFNGVKLK